MRPPRTTKRKTGALPLRRASIISIGACGTGQHSCTYGDAARSTTREPSRVTSRTTPHHTRRASVVPPVSARIPPRARSERKYRKPQCDRSHSRGQHSRAPTLNIHCARPRDAHPHRRWRSLRRFLRARLVRGWQLRVRRRLERSCGLHHDGPYRLVSVIHARGI